MSSWTSSWRLRSAAAQARGADDSRPTIGQQSEQLQHANSSKAAGQTQRAVRAVSHAAAKRQTSGQAQLFDDEADSDSKEQAAAARHEDSDVDEWEAGRGVQQWD